jgi:hypothetical protein
MRKAPERIPLFPAFGFALQVFRLHRRGNHIFLASPIPKIDDLAALATEGKKRIVGRYFFLADGTLHGETGTLPQGRGSVEYCLTGTRASATF